MSALMERLDYLASLPDGWDGNDRDSVAPTTAAVSVARSVIEALGARPERWHVSLTADPDGGLTFERDWGHDTRISIASDGLASFIYSGGDPVIWRDSDARPWSDKNWRIDDAEIGIERATPTAIARGLAYGYYHLPEPAAPAKEYVAGFLLSEQTGEVVLIRKNRPDWQAGRLNGVGGKIEHTTDSFGMYHPETPAAAMRREFREETSLDLGPENSTGWEPFATIDAAASTGGRIYFFRLFVDEKTLASATDEKVEIHGINAVVSQRTDVLPNLRWLVPLAAYTHDTYEPLVASERPGQTERAST